MVALRVLRMIVVQAKASETWVNISKLTIAVSDDRMRFVNVLLLLGCLTRRRPEDRPSRKIGVWLADAFFDESSVMVKRAHSEVNHCLDTK